MNTPEKVRPIDPQARQPEPPTGERFRFPKQVRLRTKSDFDRVYQDHAYARGPLFNVLVATNDRGYSRLGLSVSRYVGNAVRRNRWKRLLRESFRLMQSKLPAGIDIIAIPQGMAAPPPLNQLASAFQSLVRKAHIHLKPKRKGGTQASGDGPSNKKQSTKRSKKRKRR